MRTNIVHTRRAMASGFMSSSDAGQAAGDKVSEAKGARAVMLTADLLEDQ